MSCFVCGKPIKQNYVLTRFGYELKGRPKIYCSDDCRDFQKYFIACQDKLFKIDLSDAFKRKIRGDFFRVANSLVLSSSVGFGTKTPSANNINLAIDTLYKNKGGKMSTHSCAKIIRDIK